MAHYYNEGTRVKIPALITLSRLGYKYISLKNVHYDPEGNIFTSIFSESIKKINKEKGPVENGVERRDKKRYKNFGVFGEHFYVSENVQLTSNYY